jgi:hypothetical protein
VYVREACSPLYACTERGGGLFGRAQAKVHQCCLPAEVGDLAHVCLLFHEVVCYCQQCTIGAALQGLSAYPFGRVRCQLELGSWSYGPWYVNVSMQGKVRHVRLRRCRQGGGA